MPQKWIAALTARVSSCMGTAKPHTARLAQMRAVQAVTLEITRELDLTTLLGLIVRHAGTLLGVLILTRLCDAGLFTEEDLEVLEAFAGQAAIALENAKLYEQQWQARDVAEGKAQQLAILMAISTALGAQRNLAAIFQTIGPEVLKYTRFDQLAITLLDADGQHWRRALLIHSQSEYQTGSRVPVAGTRTGWVITHRQPMVVNDLAVEASPTSSLDANMLRSGIRSSIYIPLQFGEHIFGTLNVHSRTPGTPTPETVTL